MSDRTNISDAAKIKAGRMKYHLEAVAPGPVLQKIKALFEIVAVNQGIVFDAKLPDILPAVRADPERFDQVMANMVSNALKFTKRGGRVVLGAKAINGAVEIYVSDTGRGISHEDLSKLFERFRPVGASGAESTVFKGTGIGLAVTKEAVEAMGGKMMVESEIDKGSRFLVQLPIFK